MKNYVELERLGYVLPQELSVGLILNGLTKTSITWGRQLVNYMLCSLTKGKGKANGKGKDKQVYIPKRKNHKTSAKEHPAKDDTCHHYKEVGHCKRNCPAYLVELIKKKKKVGTASSSDRFTDFGISVSKNNVYYFNDIPSNGIYEIDMHNLGPNVNSIYNVSTKSAKHNSDSTYLWHYRLAHISKKRIEKLEHEGLLKSTDDESFDQCVSCLSGASYFITFTDDYSRYGYVYLLKHKHEVFETFKVFKNEVENQLEKTIKALRSDRGGEYISQEFKDYLKAIGIDYALESATRILNMVPTKKVDKTPYELWYGKVPNLSYLKVWGYKALVKRDTPDKLQQRSKNLITQEVSRRAIDLEEIQDEDTSPSEITSEIPMEVKGFKPPQEEKILIRRSERTHRAPNRLCLNVEWIDAMNAEIQSMMDNMVWVLVNLPPCCKTVGSKWIFKKNTDMDGIVHTYKARLVAKGYTQLYGVDYEETFSPVTNIRAIRILISIAAYYDYKIWKMDIKTAFLNGYLDEDIYMVQPE
ncbi:retrotransposon protein, putative, ty1-copia subclass, partial [Tanacetum coccineum]